MTLEKRVYYSDGQHRLNESPSIIIRTRKLFIVARENFVDVFTIIVVAVVIPTTPSPVSNVSYGIEHYNIRPWMESHSDVNHMLTLCKDEHLII